MCQSDARDGEFYGKRNCAKHICGHRNIHARRKVTADLLGGPQQKRGSNHRARTRLSHTRFSKLFSGLKSIQSTLCWRGDVAMIPVADGRGRPVTASGRNTVK